MDVSFPELTSFGTLLKFALVIEEAVARLAREAAEMEVCAKWGAELAACAKKHTKRNKQLERLRRERLNEVVLQPISGMERADYLPDMELPVEPAAIIAVLVANEEKTARFFDDAADIAANVLGGVDRTFRKLAKESRRLAEGLRHKAL